MKTSVVLAILSCSLLLVETKTTQNGINPGSQRIFDGRPAVEGQFPWQVGVGCNNGSGNYFCGGSLIDSEWVLTAAQCVKGVNNFQLHFGGLTLNPSEPQKVVVAATEYKLHPSLNVALIHLTKPMTLTYRIKPITLPPKNYTVLDGDSLVVSGWGRTDLNSDSARRLLHYTDLIAISEEKCKEIYGKAVNGFLFCAKGNLMHHNICDSDVGGPLIAYDNGVELQVGVSSLIHKSGCENGIPSGYILVSRLIDWIEGIKNATTA